MSTADVAAQLRALASRVRRLSPPLSSDPERFHEERSEIAFEIVTQADRLGPRSAQEREPARAQLEVERARGRQVTTTRTIKGRRVLVQERRPRPGFSVFVG
jgi:hypothetical protein